MIRTLCLGLAVLAPQAMIQSSESADAADVEAIRSVIQSSYVDGLFRKRDPDLMREGFAPTFVMQVFWNGELSSRTLDTWLEKMKLDKVPSEKSVEGKVEVLDIAGDAAVARLDFYEESKHKYTDYFGLYETEDGWKIVSKHFHGYR